MLREEIEKDVEKATSKLAGRLVGQWDSGVEVTRTNDPKFGDFATNLPLKIRHDGEHSAMEFAKILAGSLKNQPYVKKLEVKEPGFVNFFIKNEIWQKQVEDVLKLGKNYGSNQSARGKKARVEFVSANPTGPLHFGNARGGPIGDVLASVLQFCGYKVLREYYHNDLGEQVRKLGDSIVNVILGAELEHQEYKGEYILELAKKIGRVKDSLEAGKKAVAILLGEILEDCKAMGISYDKVYAESDFVKDGQTKKVIETLDKKKVLKKQGGAIWFAPKDVFLKDRECVVVKSDGAYTYFSNDIAYHNLKFNEKADLVVDILGANHHGHVPRLKAAVSALGFDAFCLHVILYQWVRFKRGRKLVAMSKRSGTFVTCREVLDEVGCDALRFFILMHDANSHIDFDLDLAKENSTKNPVYYVQYANARIHSILAKLKVKNQRSKVNYELLTTNYELDLIKQISKLPELVEDIAESFAVHRLTGYATELADSFHRFYENCPILTSQTKLKEARINLLFATQITLGNTLNLLGISAPQKM